jgi:hypothetical protein
MLGRLSVPATFFARHAGDSGKNGRIRISGIAGINPDINVRRHADDWPRTVGNVPAFSMFAKAPLTTAIANPPKDEKAWVQPSTFSRCLGWGNSSASQATAATNSTHTPTNFVHRRMSSIGKFVTKAEPNALRA